MLLVDRRVIHSPDHCTKWDWVDAIEYFLFFHRARRSRSVRSIITTGPKVKEKNSADNNALAFKGPGEEIKFFFFFFFFTVKSGQNICLRAVVNFKTSCRQWQASVWTSVEIGFKPVDKTQSNGIEVRIICFGWDLHTFSSNLYTHLAMPPPHRCLNIRSCGELLQLLISQVLLSTFFNARKNTENLISSR